MTRAVNDWNDLEPRWITEEPGDRPIYRFPLIPFCDLKPIRRRTIWSRDSCRGLA